MPDLLETTVWENLGVFLVQFLVGVWFFILGSAIGSLLNVIAYRFPAGKNLWWPPSACPVCETPILPRDNVPVLGWLLLRGRCRACQNPISPRYPIVEGLTGLLFVFMGQWQVFSGGANLPIREPDLWTGPIWTVLYLHSNIVAISAFHMVMFSALLAVVLMDWDGKPTRAHVLLPWTWFLAAIVGVLYPSVYLVPVLLTMIHYPIFSAILQSIFGWVVGFGLGAMFLSQPKEPKNGAATALALGGIFTGWQSVSGAALLAFIFNAMGRLLKIPRFTPTWAAAIGIFVHHGIWRWWDNITFLPGSRTPGLVWLAWLTGSIIIYGVWMWNIQRRQVFASAGD